MELSGEFPVKLLCETMGIQRSSFYNWKKHLSNQSGREKSLLQNITLFREYHMISITRIPLAKREDPSGYGTGDVRSLRS